MSLVRSKSSRVSGIGVQEFNGDSIKVVCRFRPSRDVTKKDVLNLDHRGREVLDKFIIDHENGEIEFNESMSSKSFKFDRVFGTNTTQIEIFNEVKGVIHSVMTGFNGTIMAYGQTSAGKSFSMEGASLYDEKLRGIIPRSIEALFKEISETDDTIQFQVAVSYYEVYCEKVRDLLDPEKVNLKIRENKNRFIVQDVTEIYCTDVESVLRVIEMGKTNRAAAPTLMNAESSRSHSILSINVTQNDKNSGRIKRGNLFLVDLAGSEKVSKTGAKGARLEEAKNINSSLTTLGMVINSLCEGNSSHVPYRDSKLTMILQEALGGNSKTTLLICCNPEANHSPESISTLRFGERAKTIKNQVRINEELSIDELKNLLIEAKKEIANLKKQLNNGEPSLSSTSNTFSPASPVTSTLTLSSEKEEELLSKIDSLKARIITLEEEIEIEKMKVSTEHEQFLIASSEIDALKSTISNLEDKLIKATLENKKFQTSSSSPITKEENSDDFDLYPTDIENITNSSVISPPAVPSTLETSSNPTPTNNNNDDESIEGLESTSKLIDDNIKNALELSKRILPALPTPTTSSKGNSSPSPLSPNVDDGLQYDENFDPQLAVQEYAEMYRKLKEDYDQHIPKLMFKLVQEEQKRLEAEEKFLETQNLLYENLDKKKKRQSGIFSIFNSSSSKNDEYPSERRQSISLNSIRNSIIGDTTKKAREREYDSLLKAYELSEFRNHQLISEMEANREAQTIVMETKESVMRNLARQNSQLSIERDQLAKKNEELSQSVEHLTQLLRSLQQNRSQTLNKVANNGQISGNSNINAPKFISGGHHIDVTTPPLSPSSSSSRDLM